MNRHLGSTLYFGRQYNEALHQLRHAAETQPDNAAVENWISYIYEKKGMKDEAIRPDLLSLKNRGEAQADLDSYLGLSTGWLEPILASGN